MHVLRFEAKLVSQDADDETRKFMVQFYCGDDTIQVIEICEKNSGILKINNQDELEGSSWSGRDISIHSMIQNTWMSGTSKSAV